jgi:hypothetical protein
VCQQWREGTDESELLQSPAATIPRSPAAPASCNFPKRTAPALGRHRANGTASV